MCICTQQGKCEALILGTVHCVRTNTFSIYLSHPINFLVINCMRLAHHRSSHNNKAELMQQKTKMWKNEQKSRNLTHYRRQVDLCVHSEHVNTHLGSTAFRARIQFNWNQLEFEFIFLWQPLQFYCQPTPSTSNQLRMHQMIIICACVCGNLQMLQQ